MGGRTKPWLGVGLVAIMLGAGCLAGPDSSGLTADTGDEEPVSTRVVEPEPGVFVADNRGAVRGIAINDAGLAVSGAFCLLIGTDRSVNSAKDGTFLFLNVSAGVYTLRVEHASFEAFEEPVEVRVANVTNVTVQLVPRADAGAGYVPHLHDYWGDKTEFLLMDVDHELTQHPNGQASTGQYDYAVTSGTLRPNRNASNDQADWWFVPIAGNDPSIILPGTAIVQVKLTWSAPMVQMAKLGVAYRTAFNSQIHFSSPRASGVAHEIRINASQSDSGHQKFSLWNLWLYAGQDVQGNPTGWTPQYVAPGAKVHVTVTLFKGDLALEASHINYWANGDRVVLRNHTKVLREQTVCCTRRDGRSGLFLDAIVPPGTGRLIVDFKVVYETNPGSPADFDYTLTWRKGNMNPQNTRITDFARAQPTVNEKYHKVWELDLKPEETDAFYQRRSNWLFTHWNTSYPEDAIPLDPRTRILSIEVTAIRDPTYRDA